MSHPFKLLLIEDNVGQDLKQNIANSKYADFLDVLLIETPAFARDLIHALNTTTKDLSTIGMLPPHGIIIDFSLEVPVMEPMISENDKLALKNVIQEVDPHYTEYSVYKDHEIYNMKEDYFTTKPVLIGGLWVEHNIYAPNEERSVGFLAGSLLSQHFSRPCAILSGTANEDAVNIDQMAQSVLYFFSLDRRLDFFQSLINQGGMTLDVILNSNLFRNFREQLKVGIESGEIILKTELSSVLHKIRSAATTTIENTLKNLDIHYEGPNGADAINIYALFLDVAALNPIVLLREIDLWLNDLNPLVTPYLVSYNAFQHLEAYNVLLLCLYRTTYNKYDDFIVYEQSIVKYKTTLHDIEVELTVNDPAWRLDWKDKLISRINDLRSQHIIPGFTNQANHPLDRTYLNEVNLYNFLFSLSIWESIHFDLIEFQYHEDLFRRRVGGSRDNYARDLFYNIQYSFISENFLNLNARHTTLRNIGVNSIAKYLNADLKSNQFNNKDPWLLVYKWLQQHNDLPTKTIFSWLSRIPEPKNGSPSLSLLKSYAISVSKLSSWDKSNRSAYNMMSKGFSVNVSDPFLQFFAEELEHFFTVFGQIQTEKLANADHELAKVMDLGCADGYLLAQLNKNNQSCHFTGVDYSATLIQLAEEYFLDEVENKLAKFYVDDVINKVESLLNTDTPHPDLITLTRSTISNIDPQRLESLWPLLSKFSSSTIVFSAINQSEETIETHIEYLESLGHTITFNSPEIVITDKGIMSRRFDNEELANTLNIHFNRSHNIQVQNEPAGSIFTLVPNA